MVSHEGKLVLSLQPILKSVVQFFCDRNPHLDREELLGEAQVVLLRAVRSYDPTRGAVLTSWASICLQSWFRTHAISRTWHRRFSRGAHSLPPVVRSQEFDVTRLCQEVSPDASLAVQKGLELETKTGLVGFLVRELGWEREQVYRVFEEVREALG